MNKPYYPCEHCIYFYQHYELSYEMIHKLSCGHCNVKKQIVKLSQRECKYFEEHKDKIDRVEKENHALYVLSNIEKNIANLKLYFNSDRALQQVDKCLLDRLK